MLKALQTFDAQPSLQNTSLLLRGFLEEKSPSTLLAYKRDLTDFTNFIGSTSLEAAISTLLNLGQGKANFVTLRYKAHLKERGIQATTINRRLSTLRSLIRLANILGIIPWKIEVQNLKTTPYRDTSGPGKAAYKELLEECNNLCPKLKLRGKAILHLLFDVALRRNEVASLKLENFNPADQSLKILGKGRTQQETISLPRVTCKALTEWVDFRGSKAGPMFYNYSRSQPIGTALTGNGIYKIVVRMGNRIGIKVRPHGLRHSAITEACKEVAKRKIGIEELLAFSRHKDIRTLLIYRDREQNFQGEVADWISK